MSISALRDRVRKELLEFSWSQWAQLGLSAHTTRSDRWVVDPETLVLFTAEVARRDPRLFDEVLDWMSLNGRLLSLQRLRNLTGRFPIDRKLVDAVVAWVGESTPSLHWSKAGQHGNSRRAKGVPLFSPDVASFVGEADPFFSRHGYVRTRVNRSRKANEPDVRAPVNFAFQLRLILGPGSRSEIMRILLTAADGPLDAARIADEAGFAKRNVHETLTALVGSGVVKARWSGNERVFLAFRDSRRGGAAKPLVSRGCLPFSLRGTCGVPPCLHRQQVIDGSHRPVGPIRDKLGPDPLLDRIGFSPARSSAAVRASG